jgi:hypothetical protein
MRRRTKEEAQIGFCQHCFTHRNIGRRITPYWPSIGPAAISSMWRHRRHRALGA